MITAVSMVKNSADVIETMIRGNSPVIDNWIITNNASTDNTLNILSALKDEGFNIEILEDNSKSPYQGKRLTEAGRMAVEKYSSDVIIPLDDDEIICSGSSHIDHQSLKALIEGLDQDNMYYICWRNYIPTEEDDNTQVCVALREKFCLADEEEMTKKIIIPSKLFNDETLQIETGSHFVRGGTIKEHILLKDIRMAHYPIRSAEQIASKAITGWMNRLGMPDRKADMSTHWRIMYTAIKEYGLPTIDTMMTLANLYRERPNDTEHLNVDYNPINIPSEVFDMKYTHGKEINLLKNICENAEKYAIGYAELLGRSE